MERITVCEKETAFRRRIRSYALKNIVHKDPIQFLNDAFPLFKKETKIILRDLQMIKINTCLCLKFVKRPSFNEENEIETENDNDANLYITHYFQTKNSVVTLTTKLKKWYKKNVINVHLKKIEEFQENGSGFALNEIIDLTVNNNKYVCFNGSSYIPLPSKIENKKAIINVKNTDNKCFVWSVLAALHNKKIKKNAQRVSKYVSLENELNMEGIKFPMTLKQIDRFERQNDEISINVYGIDDAYNSGENKKNKATIVPIKLTKTVKKNHIHLLLLCEGNENILDETEEHSLYYMISNYMCRTHFCWIKDLSKLIASDVSTSKWKLHICDRCLHFFYSEDKLKKHSIDCENQNSCKLTLPSSNKKWITFKNNQNQLEVPFIVYADIESILPEVISDCDPNVPKGAYQKHTAHSVGYYFHCRSGITRSYYKSYSGKDCIKWFAKQMRKIAKHVWNILNEETPMLPMSDFQMDDYENAECCYICQNEFIETVDEANNSLACENYRKVRDHSHLTGIYRGAAHSICNLQHKESRIIPIVFHNLVKYDLHFLVERFAVETNGKVNIIPQTNENYITFTTTYNEYDLFGFYEDDDVDWLKRKTIKLRFIDSFRFMSDSLDRLSSFLNNEQKVITRAMWQNLDEKKLSLLFKKGVYPYDYMNSEERLLETSLPPIKFFYNRLTDSNINEEQYRFAKKVWNDFNIQSLLDYTKIYLKTDVLLLADIFECFRSQCLQIYQLDPAHYCTTPGYTWDAMLKFTKVELELLTDIDQLLFIERGENFPCLKLE